MFNLTIEYWSHSTSNFVVYFADIYDDLAQNLQLRGVLVFAIRISII